MITAAMCARGRTLAEPRLSPDGSTLAFVASLGARAQLVTVPAEGGPELVVTADPAPARTSSYGGGVFDWALGGEALVYATAEASLQLISVTGGPARVVVDHGPASCPVVAPDGRRAAYLVDAHHVAVVSLDDGGAWPVRLSRQADFCFDPTWSPDGALVAWHEWDVPAMPWDASRIVVAPADGSADPVTVAGGDGVAVSQPRFSSTGVLAFLCDADGWLNLWLAERDGEGWGMRP